MNTQTWLYLVSGVLGGTGVSSMFKYLTTRRFQSISLEERLRAEMVASNSELKAEIATLKDELTLWQTKYMALSKEYVSLKQQFNKLAKDK